MSEDPPIRPEDIGRLAEHSLKRYSTEFGLPLKHLSSGAMAALQAYSWPGGLRELSNVVERAILLTDDKELLASDLGLPNP